MVDRKRSPSPGRELAALARSGRAGGAARSRPWLEIFASTIDFPLELSDANELGALGAAIVAAVGVGIYPDLDAAVARGIVSQTQSDALAAFAAERRTAGAAARADEERFHFMRGFNDIFFAVGVLLFGSGLGFFAGSSAVGNLIAVALIWALAELLVRRMRLVLPGVVLAAWLPAKSVYPELGRVVAHLLLRAVT
jgi:hypothetical protein